jgi:hypothetical protein
MQRLWLTNGRKKTGARTYRKLPAKKEFATTAVAIDSFPLDTSKTFAAMHTCQ